jgi:hypothetical protein
MPEGDEQAESKQAYSAWHVNRALEALPHTLLLDTAAGRNEYGSLVAEVATVIRSWSTRWSGRPEWQSFLNRKSFLHEVEEAIVPLRAVIRHFEQQADDAADDAAPPLVDVVDLCCGKGFFGMLLSYLAATHPLLRKRIGSIVLVEKNLKVRWEHVHAANADHAAAAADSGSDRNVMLAALPIVVWRGANIHEDAFEIRLHHLCNPPVPSLANSRRLLLVGIHLCRRLSSRFVELTNSLGSELVTKAVLAPCCLPAIAKSDVTVRQALRRPRAPLTDVEMDAERRAKWDGCWRCGGAHSKSSCTAPAEQARETKRLHKLKEEQLRWNYPDRDVSSCAPCDDSCYSAGAMGENSTAATVRSGGGELSVFDPSSLASCEDPFKRWCDFLLAAFHDSPKHCLEVQLQGNDGSGHTYTYASPATSNGSVRRHEPAEEESSEKKDSWNDSRRTTWLVLR